MLPTDIARQQPLNRRVGEEQQLSAVVRFRAAEVKVMIDTGASASIISEKLAESPEIAEGRIAT